MSDFGAVARAGLTIGGAFFFGAPGAVIGGIIGDVLFPVTLPGQEGPRLNELNFQRATVGSPIPIVYGTAKMAGNVIFTGGLIEEVNREEQGGKGSPPSQTVTTYTYFVDLAIGICDGEDDRPSKPQGIKRIWAYGELIFDVSPQGYDETEEAYAERLALTSQTQEMMTIYPGDEDQLPSPMIESYKGAGAVPAYRGLYHVEFEHFPLAKYGNAIPNFMFEVYTLGVQEDCGQYSPGTLYPWFIAERDPRNDDNIHVYAGPGSSYNAFYDNIEDAIADGLTGWLSEPINGWAKSPGANFTDNCLGTVTDEIELYLHINTVAGGFGYTCTVIPNDPPEAGNAYDPTLRVIGENTLAFSGVQVPSGPGLFWFSAGFASQAEAEATTCPEPGMAGGVSGTWEDDLWRRNCHQSSREIAVRRSIQPGGCAAGTAIAGAPGFCVINGVVTNVGTWTQVIGETFKCFQFYRAGTASFRPGQVIAYPHGPCLRNDDPDYNNQAFWEAAYADALAEGALLNLVDGLIPDDWVYGVDYPMGPFVADSNLDFVWRLDCEAVTTECCPMSLIVEDICDRAGLSAVDVSGLTTCPDGYIITRPMSARDALTPLRMYGLWDCVESGTVLRFVERGAAIVATLTTDDLGVGEGGSENPSVMETTRVQEKDLPRRVRLHYPDIDQIHEPGEQAASRISTEATNELDVELAVVMDGDYAAQLAEIMLYEAWVARNSYRFTLDNSWLALEPADCIEIPVDGQTERVRITAIDYAIGGILRVEAVRDDDGSYTSTAAGTPPTDTGSGGRPPASALVCPSVMVLLDLPRLRDVDVDCGYYAAVYGLCTSWTCAAIYRSSDGGVTYGRVARTDVQATVGTATFTDVPDEESSLLDSPISYDTVNTISVTLGYGTLASVTDDQIEAGFNAAAVGRDNRWVIIQFKTAVLDSGGTWVLSDILWGLRETAEHLDTLINGDTFVLLNDSALMRIAETSANEGVQKLFKVVTCGESVEDVDPVGFSTDCLSFRPTVIAEEPPPAPDENDPASTCTQLLIWNIDSGQYEPAPLYLQQLCNVAFDSSVVVGDILSYTSEDSSGPQFSFVPQGSDTGGVVDEAVVTGSPATTLLLSGLDLDADEEYVVLVKGENASGGTMTVSLYFNGDTTPTNYRRQLFRSDAGASAAQRGNDAQVAEIIPAGDVFGFQFILRRNFDGHPHAMFRGYDGDGNVLRNFVGNVRREVSENVTSLQITAATTDGLAVGTHIKVFRLSTTPGDTGGGTSLNDLTDVAIGSPLADRDLLSYDGSGNWGNVPGGFVGEAVLSSPGTTLTVSGLNLATDVAYYFEFITDNQSGGTITYTAVVNNDTTATNYDQGRMGMNSSSLGSNASTTGLMVNLVPDGLPTTIHGWIRHNFDGKTLIVGQDAEVETTNRIGGWWQVQHRTVGNMTRFDVVATADMPIGSTLRIYRAFSETDTSAASSGVEGPGSSTDNALARFHGALGEFIQNSDSILSDADEISTPNASAAEIGFKGIPQRSISGDDTLVLADAGGQVYKASGGTVTVTIPANGSVPYPVGTGIEIINDDTETMTIAITTDTLVVPVTGATGSRALAARGWAVIKKVTSTRWFISGAGLT